MFELQNSRNENVETDLELTIERNLLQIQQLEDKHAQLVRQTQELFAQLKVDPEHVDSYLADPNNFSAETWTALQQHRKELDAHRQRDLTNIRNPIENKKRQNERNVAPGWIFVR
jgi:predicted glycoside hydrolase/deacetylase ChbG (UPF0249 family)